MEVALIELCRGEVAAASPAAENIGQQASGQGAASEARLARLEAQLAQLSAVVAKGVAAAPAAVKPPRQAAAQAAPVSAVRAETAPAAVIDGQGQELWQQLLQALQQRNKPQILACLQGGGRFAGLGDSHFHIHFSSSLMASLTMRNYRRTLEEILTELAGRPLQLVARGEDLPPAPPPPPKKAPKPEPIPEPETSHIEVPQEERPPALDAAVQIFGDNIVAVEEEN